MSEPINPFEFKQQYAQQNKSTAGMPKGIRNLLTSLAVLVVLLLIAIFAFSSFTFIEIGRASCRGRV